MIATADTEWRSRRFRDENEADTRVCVTVDGGVIVAELVELLFESRAGPVASAESVSDTMVIIDFENWQGVCRHHHTCPVYATNSLISCKFMLHV